MNGALRNAVTNPRLASLISFFGSSLSLPPSSGASRGRCRHSKASAACPVGTVARAGRRSRGGGAVLNKKFAKGDQSNLLRIFAANAAWLNGFWIMLTP
jgi:hypothetical protein